VAADDWMMKDLFDACTLGPIKTANRIVRSATTECLADERGNPTDELVKTHARLADGGVGLIITGQAAIRQDGRLPVHRCLMVDSDESIGHYERLVEEVHRRNTAIILQVGHAGRQTRRAVTGKDTIAPSRLRDKYWNEQKPRELEDGEIEELIIDFIRAIERARKAGFDGVQLHAAHGWLLSEFLSPYMNRRQDRWGGTTENRFRIIKRVVEGARERVGNYPVLAKINGTERSRKGMSLKEAVEISRMLEAAGCAGVEVSCGVGDDGLMSTRVRKYPVDAALAFSYRFRRVPAFAAKMFAPIASLVKPLPRPLENYNAEAAREIKARVKVPVIVVGGIRKVADARRMIADDELDYVAMCRPFIAEPEIVRKWMQGEESGSRCTSCGYCLVSLEERPVQCYNGKL